MKIKVTQTRIGTYEPDLKHYPDGSTSKEVIEIDNDNAHEDLEFMDYLDATEEFVFEVIEEQLIGE